MFKVNNKISRTRCEICPKLTIKTPERRHYPLSGVFIVNFEQISHLVLLFLLLTFSRQMSVGKRSAEVYVIWFLLIITKPKLSKASNEDNTRDFSVKTGKIRRNCSPKVLSITFFITHQRRTKIEYKTQRRYIEKFLF